MIRRYKILCIGVNHVPGSGFKPLSYAGKNAANAAAYFKTLNYAEVTSLTGKEATKTKIIRWLTRINTEPGMPGPDKSKEETTVILFFSGHASAKKNKRKKEWERCLWVHGETGNDLETLYLKMPGILNLLNNPFHRLIIVIDACYHLEGKSPKGSIFEEFKKTEPMTSLKPYVIISSSAAGRHLFEDPALEQGVLTHYLLKTLAGKYTFFLKKQIAFFKFLQILGKKVKSHRFSTNTGRKRVLPMLMDNGVMAHFSGKSSKLPILEPTPLITDPTNHFFKRKTAQFFHFFTRTRIRTKVSLACIILGILVLLLYLVDNSMVRIHFNSPQQALFQETLLEPQRYSLDKLGTQQVGKDRYQDVSFYLFKHNWVNAFLQKLDETGKIILLGNLLGHRLNNIDERQILGFALENSHDVFYWDPEDVRSLLRTIRDAYRNFNKSQKQKALELLAKLGKNGEQTAQWGITFTKETDQDLRNLFLQHFYTPDFIKKNPEFLNIYDYLYLTRNKKEIPPDVDLRLRRETRMYLQTAADSIPGTLNDITDKTKLSKIYKKLGILAVFGSHHFRKKAAAVFEQAFFPDEVFGLSRDAGNLQDKLWLLELYMKRVQQVDEPYLVWYQLVFRYIPRASREEKGRILAIIMNTNLELVQEKYRDTLLNYLQYIDPHIVPLADWGNWIKRYSLDPKHVFYWIIEKDYEEVFSFLENHYGNFKNLFNGGVFDRLYEFNKTKTVNLAKGIFKISTGKDQLQAAVFLYNKDYPGYSTFILEFLEKAGDNIRYQQIIQGFYGSINEVLIKLINNNKNLRQRLKRVSFHPKFFYRFFQANLQLWPEQTIQKFLTSEIPRSYIDGYPFLKKCEQLPDEKRKKMLFKIINADIEPHFRSRVEAALANHYPREFLEMVFHNRYSWNRETGRNVVSAYQEFSYKELKEELTRNLRTKSYWKVGFICESLVGKKHEELNIEDIRYILAEFNRPLERMVLRELRYYLHQRRFLLPSALSAASAVNTIFTVTLREVK
jgi:hypothetical protein